MIVENIESTFDFGKFKGETIKDVALKDPSYFEWLCKTVSSFVITNETIDSISDYCLAVFFNNPEKYLNEEGNFTRCTKQYLKNKGEEIIIGTRSEKILINKILSNNDLLNTHHYDSKNKQFIVNFGRQVFEGNICKKNLLERENK
jgi:hypothetical protein